MTPLTLEAQGHKDTELSTVYIPQVFPGTHLSTSRKDEQRSDC
ncbi:hypothetical protein E2C01_076481 [Portunus trituberculatus]|uniref:Uncharacterized protein n=1 Tax=Portunus trituberculatus TaxID=210409 RepID=A0A5B7IHW2_PORTR|nr:hypothetical protein [Portunus trituberculatus]